MSTNRVLGIVATVLAILSIVWTTALQWQALTDRVAALEKAETYYHGELPKESK